MSPNPQPAASRGDTRRVVALPDALAWWRTTILALQEREAESRREARGLRVELSDTRIDLKRAETTILVRDRALGEAGERERALSEALEAQEAEAARLRTELEQQAKLATQRDRQIHELDKSVRALKAEKRVLSNRAERLGRTLEGLYASRTYRLVRLLWRIRRAITPPPFRGR